MALLLLCGAGVPAILFVLSKQPAPSVDPDLLLYSGYGCCLLTSLLSIALSFSRTKEPGDDPQTTPYDPRDAAIDALLERVSRAHKRADERQDAFLEAHAKIAERMVRATTDLEATNAVQRAAADGLSGVLAQVPQTLSTLQNQLQAWSGIDPVDFDAVRSQLSTTAQSLSETLAVLRAGAQDCEETSVSLKSVAESAGAATEDLAGAVQTSVDRFDTAAQMAEDAAQKVSAAGASADRLSRLARRGLKQAVASFGEGRTALTGAAGALNEAAGRVSVASSSLMETANAQQSTAQEGLQALQAQIEEASQTLAQHVSDTAAQAQSCIDDTASAAPAALERALEAPAQALEALIGSHQDSLSAHVDALAGHGDALAQARATLTAICAMTEAVETQRQSVQSALGEQLAAQADTFAPLAALAGPAQTSLQALVQLNVDAYDKTLKAAQSAAEAVKQAALEPPQELSAIIQAVDETRASLLNGWAKLERSIPDTVADGQDSLGARIDGLSATLTQLATRDEPEELGAIAQAVDDIRLSLSRGWADLEQAMNEAVVDGQQSLTARVDGLGATLTQLKGLVDSLPSELSMENIGKTLEERFASGLAGVACAQESALAGGAETSKMVRQIKGQVLKLSDTVSTQHEGVLGSLKQLRSQQVAPLKAAVKALPAAVADPVKAYVDAQMSAVLARFEAQVPAILEEAARASAPATPEPTPPLSEQDSLESAAQDVAHPLGGGGSTVPCHLSMRQYDVDELQRDAKENLRHDA
ncbi:MAG: hypothetical protein AAF337_00400 [Pseudomonadota bacterium]